MKSRLVSFSDKSAVSETCKTETLLKSYRLVPLIPLYQALALISHTHTLRVTYTDTPKIQTYPFFLLTFYFKICHLLKKNSAPPVLL